MKLDILFLFLVMAYSLPFTPLAMYPVARSGTISRVDTSTQHQHANADMQIQDEEGLSRPSTFFTLAFLLKIYMDVLKRLSEAHS